MLLSILLFLPILFVPVGIFPLSNELIVTLLVVCSTCDHSSVLICTGGVCDTSGVDDDWFGLLNDGMRIDISG
jgi:hypothetical protein